MLKNVGIFRVEKKMRNAREKIQELKAKYKLAGIDDKDRPYNTELINFLELGFALHLAEVIAKGAEARKESRGSHYRLDYPERLDDKWLRHTMATYTETGPTLDYEDVNITKFEPKEREY